MDTPPKFFIRVPCTTPPASSEGHLLLLIRRACLTTAHLQNDLFQRTEGANFMKIMKFVPDGPKTELGCLGPA